LGLEFVPCVHWKLGGGSASNGDEVFFPCLDGAFGAVCTVVTRGCKLDGDVITSVGETIQRSSVLVVETQELGYHAPFGEESNSAGVRGNKLFGIARRHKFDVDVVAVFRVYN
jgi:hypothetical protein